MYFTDRQLKVLSFVEAFRREHGCAPTLKEIASRFAISKATALEHLRALEKKRAIRRSRHQPRSIELVDGPPTSSTALTLLPVSGELRAGQGISYLQHAADLDVTTLVPTDKNGHVLRVVGDHLLPLNLMDGDLLVIEPRPDPEPGELILVAVDRDHAALGRYVDGHHPGIVLASAADGAPTSIAPSQIRGLVRAMIRRFGPHRPR